MIYFDTTFLVRLYLDESGSEQVRTLAGTTSVIRSSILAKMETEGAIHRHFREGKIEANVLQQANLQLEQDQNEGLLVWLPLTPAVIERVKSTFIHLPANVFLRAGDAIHLATAAEAGFKEIYSNDRHLLAATPLFKLKGINPLAKPA